MKKIKNFKLGSDPELFLKRIGSNTPFPAIGIVPGTKNKPEPMKDLPKGFSWQVDNMSCEFNTPPSSSAGEWVKNHLMALTYIKKNIPTDLDLMIVPSCNFEHKYLSMPGACEFGCEPDYNAWIQDINPKPYCNDETLRSCGGHIHIGFEEGKDMSLCEEVVKVVELFVSVPALFIDNDHQRRFLYGKSGSFRFGKSYTGVECRTPSNFWLQSEELMYWVYEQVEHAIEFINQGNQIDSLIAENIQEAINNYNLDIAQMLIEKFNIGLPKSYVLSNVKVTK